MRSSIVETRDHVTLVVPNSKLVNNSVNNLSHFTPIVRFTVTVGVAYGSDTELVKKLLLEAVNKVPRVLSRPLPFVRFTNFGDSSLDFEVLFFTREHIFNEDIKSGIVPLFNEKYVNNLVARCSMLDARESSSDERRATSNE